MNPAKCDEHDYIHFMIAAQRAFSCTEAARCQPGDADAPPAHDAFTRLLTRWPPDTGALCRETRGLVNLDGGILVLDDSTLDKPHARSIELVTRHWSGKHHRVVRGINLDNRALLCGPCNMAKGNRLTMSALRRQNTKDGHLTRPPRTRRGNDGHSIRLVKARAQCRAALERHRMGQPTHLGILI